MRAVDLGGVGLVLAPVNLTCSQSAKSYSMRRDYMLDTE